MLLTKKKKGKQREGNKTEMTQKNLKPYTMADLKPIVYIILLNVN
jgi:hypothetical protein